jgi:hypothetical protein
MLAACGREQPPTDPAPPPSSAGAPAERSAGTPAESATVISPSEGTGDAVTSARTADSAAAEAARQPADADVAGSSPEYVEVTLPAGTVLAVSLETGVGSATSNVEDGVRARVIRPVRIRGREAIPEGATLAGSVTEATRSGKVKGRARVALRFTTLAIPGRDEYAIRTRAVVREARATKKKDAAKIGVGAAAGAVVGGIVGGGKGAAVGSAVGGGAGTAVVLSQRGEEVSLPAGTTLTVRLAAPAAVRVPSGR